MALKNAKNVLSMDLVQLSRHIRQRFQASLPGTEDIDENRDLAFQILALKDSFRDNRREHLKIFYNLVQATHQGFFNHKTTRNLYVGFPYLPNHYRDNYRNFSGETPVPASGVGDSMLLNAGTFLTRLTLTSASSHFSQQASDDIKRYLDTSHQFDEDVRVNKLYLKVLAELLMKRSLPRSFQVDLKISLENAVKLWDLKAKEEWKVDHLIDILTLTCGVGVDDPSLVASVETAIAPRTFYLPTRVKLLLLYALGCRRSSTDSEPPVISTVIDNLINSFYRDYRSLDLKDSLILVDCFSHLKYRERLLDLTVTDNIIPRMAKIRLEDVLQLLQNFVTLNFRCSKVIKHFEESPIFSTVTVVDLAVLSLLYEKLNFPTHGISSMINKQRHLLEGLADRKLMDQLEAVGSQHVQ